VLSYKYPLETYPVETWDGFILRLYRIPYGVKNATGAGKRPVVVLHHGVTLASNCFVVLDPGSSLGFLLADAGGCEWHRGDGWAGTRRSGRRGQQTLRVAHDGCASSCQGPCASMPPACKPARCADAGLALGRGIPTPGFDVWMVNMRGNTYSKGNRHYRTTDQAYWRFSMDELALIDLPTQIDYILEKTGQPSAAVIGHSQGGTLPLMLMAVRPEYNNKIWLFGSMGSVVYAELVRAPYLIEQAKFYSTNVSREWGDQAMGGSCSAADGRACSAVHLRMRPPAGMRAVLRVALQAGAARAGI
jgi:pimeloyl-ACP methyl ester carboxylesterase